MSSSGWRCSSTSPASRARRQLLDEVAGRIPVAAGRSYVLVAVDGPDGAGKTCFADELAATVDRRGRPVVRVSADDFHHVRDIRYRRGRDSPVGFWLDSFDYDRLIADVLAPLGRAGGGRYRPLAHDVETDAVLDRPWRAAPPGSVVIIDGLFLHRDELVDYWDFSVFLDVPFEVTAERMRVRDDPSPALRPTGLRRYVEGQRIYYRECRPHTRATIVVDNTDVDRPRLSTVAAGQRRADPCDVTITSYGRGISQYLAASGPTSGLVRGYLDRYAGALAGGHVLELGSGPGCDADYLESRGLRVERTDATTVLVQRLRARGHHARLLDARAHDYGGPFDGVWANAVLLHLSPEQLEQALLTAWHATRPGGVLAVTLKEGDGSRWSTAKLDRPRHFTYWRADAVADVLFRTGWVVDTSEHYDGRLEPWLFALGRASSSDPRPGRRR